MAEDYSKYYDNIQAEINKRKKVNPNDPSIKELEKYRQTKIDVTNEANSVGAKTVDPNYVMSRYLGTTQQYANNAMGAGVGSNKLNTGSGIVAQPSGGITQSEINRYIEQLACKDAPEPHQCLVQDESDFDEEIL